MLEHNLQFKSVMLVAKVLELYQPNFFTNEALFLRFFYLPKLIISLNLNTIHTVLQYGNFTIR
jgi:hypothetical protein